MTHGGDVDVVRLTRLTKTFGGNRGIRDVDLVVRRGQVFGFLGPNGAGKSTTIRLIMGLYRPTSGRAEVFGLDTDVKGPLVRRQIGYIPGELAFHPRLTGREILDRIAHLRGGVEPARRAWLEGRFEAELDRPLHTLSKGNRQKIGIVQAFMHDPQLLVLDEPTSGLDPLLQKEFADLLEDSVDRGRSVFLSSHDLDEVQRLAHQVAIIREGGIVAVDTVQGLRARAPRTIELTFRQPVGPTAFSHVHGAHVTAHSGRNVSLTVEGDLGQLLAAAARLDPVEMTARPVDLEELFRTFYAQKEVTVDAH
ncbi:ABC transporter ATP-binding protein [Monashia sp. NPDC004114]